MSNLIKRYDDCRLCGHDNIETIFSLGDQYVNNFVLEEQIGEGVLAPLEVCHCSNCDLTQLRHTAPQELLYSGFYWYRSGVTDTMKAALKEIVEEVYKEKDLNSNSVFFDIGANDGTMLSFCRKGETKVGCEPATNLQPLLAKVADISINDFWSADAFHSAMGDDLRKCDVVTAIGMFYDLDEPKKFVQDIAKVLNDDGIFVAQLMTLDPMIRKNDLGNLCHEHIEFYSYKSLVYMYESCGLEIYRIDENEINGGSYRIWARKYQQGSISYSENTSVQDLIAFKDRIDNIKNQIVKFIKDEKSKGKITHVYGASTKGNVILQYFGITPDLCPFASERSPEKFGRYTVGSWIPIVSEEESKALKPDYYLVLPWAFFDEMYERELEWRSGGGQFIVPFPTMRIVQ